MIHRRFLKIVSCTFGGYYFVQLITYLIAFMKERDRLYYYDNQLREIVLTDETARSFYELIRDESTASIYIVFVLTSIYTLCLFYSCYVESKCIYTILRLPEKRLHIAFYKSLVNSSIWINLLVLFSQWLIIYVYYGFYLLIIPRSNRIGGGWMEFWSATSTRFWFPMYQPWEVFRPIGLCCLTPVTLLLIAFAQRSKRKCLFAVLGLLITGLTVYLSISYVSIGFISLIAAIFLTVVMGIYYLNRVEIA